MNVDLVFRRPWFFGGLVLLLAGLTGPACTGQQSDDSKPASAAVPADDDDAKGDESTKEEKDPFAVPENATAEELFAFIRRVKLMQGRSLESVMRAAKAAAAAADAIRNLADVSEEDELKALQEQLPALNFLQRYDPKSRQMLQDLLTDLETDSRAEFQRIGMIEGFKSKISSASTASKAEQEAMIGQLQEIFAGREFDREAYTLFNALASAVSRSDSVDLAASLYEDMAARMSQSNDPSLVERAPKMMGAARRVRLPGSLMEIVGTTTEGEPFDWASYRGKVVLVDFWASWCGPCRAEIPNMKRNLEQYGEKGFAIVGVNLDRTLEDCQKYVEDEGLTWTNLMSDKEGERGWDNPLATYYGVSAIPTAILVDQEGKVVSLNARGPELNRLLVELLGEPEPEVAEGDDATKANQGQTESSPSN